MTASTAAQQVAETAATASNMAISKVAQSHLLQHANEVRKHANLDTLDNFIGQSGYSWIEMMISHAKDSHESYASSSSHQNDADGTLAHVFQHQMTADLLKTPSPKKKRAIAHMDSRMFLKHAAHSSSAIAASDPFVDSDKENEHSSVIPLGAATGKPFSPKKTALPISSSSPPPKQQAAAPKRKLSTMAHTKSSSSASGLASGSSSPRRRSSVMAPTHATVAAAQAPKSSFLSKSIMRVEQDQRSLEDAREIVSSIQDLVTSPPKPKVKSSSSGLKRKSDPAEEEQIDEERRAKRPTKSLESRVSTASKDDFVDAPLPLQTAKEVEKDTQVPVTETSEKQIKTLQPPQSLREKIESFSTQKNVASSAATAKSTKAVPQKAKDQSSDKAKMSSPSRNFSSMSTHSVGIGAAQISSPIFSRSNSRNTLVNEPVSPSERAQQAKDDEAEQQVELLLQEEPKKQVKPAATASSSKAQSAVKATISPSKAKPVQPPVSTTPLNSPGPTTYSLYPSIVPLRESSVVSPPPKNRSPVRPEGLRLSIDQTSDSDAGAAYDTSSDGDLSLVDLINDPKGVGYSAKGKTSLSSSKANALAPRPPGSSLRAATATTASRKNETIAIQPPRVNTFMPTSNRSPSRLGGSTVPTSNAALQPPSTPNGHASWGGSISSKLKGMLGFSSTTTPSSNGFHTLSSSATAASSSSSAAYKSQASSSSVHGKTPSTSSKPLAVLTRKESFVPTAGSGGGKGSVRSTNGEKKAVASVVRSGTADQHRKKDLDQLEDGSASVREKDAKAGPEASNKRIREEAVAGPSNSTTGTQSSSVKGAAPSLISAKTKSATVGAAAGRAMAQQIPQVKQPSRPLETKKRKSNEGNAIPVGGNTQTVAPGKAATLSKASAVPQTAKNTVPAAKTVSQASTKSGKNDRPQPPLNAVFSDHNPFQRAQQQQQQQALAAVAQQMQKHKASNPAAPAHNAMSNLSPNSKMKVAATGHIELEEPDSAYSDSDDEETIRRRMQHKPWETREGLALALEAQASVDADMIFGIPQGGVPLDEILPAETDQARVRRMRPRSSSATWSRDGLKQFEIDRYNERMGIEGPGVQLSSANSHDRPSAVGRMSALGQSAMAQAQASASKKTSGDGQAFYR